MKNTPAVLKSLAFTVLVMVALCTLAECGINDYQARAKERSAITSSVLKERTKERSAIISSVLKERTKERSARISSVLKERTKELQAMLEHATDVL